jgi:hypothetical protein
MRSLAALLALVPFLSACDGGTPAGCRAVSCVCADGSTGTRACGADTCVCEEVGACALGYPDAWDFGGVPPGMTALAQVPIANTGDGDCAIAAARLDGCGPEFGLDPAYGSATVPPDGIARIPVTFRPEVGTGEAACALVFDAPGSNPSHHAISLVGHADTSCLTVEPRALAFDLGIAGCGTAEGTVRVANGCGAPLVLEGLSLRDAGFFVRSQPTFPWTLLPGTWMDVVVGYRPQAPGAQAGTLELAVRGLDPVAVALSGQAGEAAWRTDHFVQEPLPQVDLLFVIDNGLSMAEQQAVLRSNLLGLLSYLQLQHIDWQFGVTTTGLAPGGDCPGGVGGGEDGRLFPVVGGGPRVWTPATPNLEAVVAENLAVGACRDGPNEPLEAALRAVTSPVATSADDPRHPEPADGNLGFLRPDAMLEVMAITDRRDTSPGSANYYKNGFLALKGFDHPERFVFHAVTGDRETGCTRAGTATAEPGDTLIDMVEATGGGVFASICDPDWSEAFREMSSRPFDPQVCFVLTDRPADSNLNGSITDTEGELEVRVNGAIARSRGPQGQAFWTYDLSRNAVCFNPLALPPPGAAIDVRYRLECLVAD